jgi:quercetin dioxygenase-like cupin family protein
MKTSSSARTEPFTLGSHEIEALPWKPFRDWPGVTGKVLWRDNRRDSGAGLMRLEPESRVPPHLHPYAVHHLWVLEGACRVGDTALGPGSFCFVPAGVEHRALEAGPEGCVLLFVSEAADMD